MPGDPQIVHKKPLKGLEFSEPRELEPNPEYQNFEKEIPTNEAWQREGWQRIPSMRAPRQCAEALDAARWLSSRTIQTAQGSKGSGSLVVVEDGI